MKKTIAILICWIFLWGEIFVPVARMDGSPHIFLAPPTSAQKSARPESYEFPQAAENDIPLLLIFIEALRDNNAEVPQEAASGLGLLAATNLPGAMQRLQEALRDDNKEVRHGAASGLGAAAAANLPGAMQRLQEALRDDNEEVRLEAAKGLGAAAAANLPGAMKLLQKALRDEDEWVRVGAASGLGAAAAANLPGVVELFQKALSDYVDPVRSGAASGLGAAAAANLPGVVELFQKALSDRDEWDVRLEAAKGLGAAAAANLPGVVILFQKALSDQYGDVRLEAAKGLDAAVAAKLPGVVILFQKALRNQYGDVRLEAAKRLGAVAAAKLSGAVKLIKETLRDYDSEICYEAASGLVAAAAANLPGVMELFQEALRDENEWVRRGATSGLGAAAAADLPGAMQLLQKALRSEDEKVLRGATSGLGVAAAADLPGAMQLLQKALRSKDERVRRGDVSGLKEVIACVKLVVVHHFIESQRWKIPILADKSELLVLALSYFASSDDGINLFQRYFEKNGDLKPFQRLMEIGDDIFISKALLGFRKHFQKELENDPVNVEKLELFLRKVYEQCGKNFNWDDFFKGMKRDLQSCNLGFFEFFSQVQENPSFYAYLKYLNGTNSLASYSLPVWWFQSPLSQEYLNMETAHKIGGIILKKLVQTSKENREQVWWEIFQEIQQKSIWPAEDIQSFEKGAAVFGYGAMFRYLGTHENIHEALFQIGDIIQSYRVMGLTKPQFFNQILFQVAQDGSVDFEGNNSYQRFNQCLKAFVEVPDWREIFRNENEISDAKFLKIRQALLEKNIGYKSFNGFQKLIQVIGMIQRKDLFRKLQPLLALGEKGQRLYDYFSYLLFHPSLKNTKAVRRFLEKPAKFLGIGDDETNFKLHEVKKPSRLLEFPCIDLTGEELRDALVLGAIDRISVFHPVKVEFYSRLDFNDGFQELMEPLRNEWEFWLVSQNIFEEESVKRAIKNIMRKSEKFKQRVESAGVDFNRSLNEILRALKNKVRLMPATLLENGARLKESYQNLRDEIAQRKLPQALQWGFRCYLVEQYAQNIAIKKRVDNKLGPKGLGSKYTAQIFAKSNPQTMVTGNECPSCMAFGSGKNNVYMFNPNVGIFVVTKEVADPDSEDGKRDRVIVQSVLTLDRKIPMQVNELKKKLVQALKKKNPTSANLVDFVGPDFPEKVSADVYIGLDSREAATNFIKLTRNGDNFIDRLDKMCTLFFQEYLRQHPQSPGGRVINREMAPVGLDYSTYLNRMARVKNYYLPQAPVPYSDKTGPQVGRLPIFDGEKAKTEVKPFRGIRKITFEDTLDVAFVENTVYKDFSEGYKNHLGGIEMELIAAEINQAVKGERRKNLSRGYWRNGKLLGYILAYAGYDKEKNEEVIFVSDIAVLPEHQRHSGVGGRILLSFAQDAAKLGMPVVANLRKGENGSYCLIKKWSQRHGIQMEESEPYEIAPGVTAVDVRIPSLKIPSNADNITGMPTALECAI